MQVLAYLLARFSEPSSYAGMGALLALAGWQFSDTTAGQLVQLLAAASGLLALFLKERGLIRVIVLVFAVAPLLAGCGGAAGKLAEAASPVIAAGCGEYAGAKAAADAIVAADALPADIGAKVAAIETFGDAACARPPARDPLATAIWFGRLAGQLATLTAAN